MALYRVHFVNHDGNVNSMRELDHDDDDDAIEAAHCLDVPWIGAGFDLREGERLVTVLPQANAYAMIRRRAAAAGIATKLGNHSFRATGITAYLKNGSMLEKAAAMANHASTRTTQLYDRRRDELSLDEVERIVI
jgi:integrase